MSCDSHCGISFRCGVALLHLPGMEEYRWSSETYGFILQQVVSEEMLAHFYAICGDDSPKSAFHEVCPLSHRADVAAKTFEFVLAGLQSRFRQR